MSQSLRKTRSVETIRVVKDLTVCRLCKVQLKKKKKDTTRQEESSDKHAYRNELVNLNRAQKCVVVMGNAIPSHIIVSTKAPKNQQCLGNCEKFDVLGKD